MPYNLLALVFLSLFFTACSVDKEPEFIGVKEIQLVEKKADALIFELLLEFHNPNVLGGTFQSEKLAFFINEVEFSQMTTPAFEVPAKENFTMPIRIALDKNTFQGKQLQMLSTILQMASSKQVNLRIKGPLQYKVLGYSSAYELDYQRRVDF